MRLRVCLPLLIAFLPGVLLSGCGDGTTETPAAAPDTAVAPTTTAMIAATQPATAASLRPALQPVCSELPMTIEAVPSAAGGTLLLVDDTGEILRLRLATGEVTCQRAFPSASTQQAPWVWGVPAGVVRLDSGLVVTTQSFGGGNWYVPDDPAEPVQPIGNEFAVGPAATDDSVWVEGADEVRLLRPAAMHFGPTFALPAGGLPVVGDGRGALVIRIGYDYQTMAADGTLAPLWYGSGLMAVNATTIVGLVCDAASCRWTTIDRTTGDHHDLDPAPIAGWLFATLAPDGARLALPAGYEQLPAGMAGPVVVDLGTGAQTRLAGGVLPHSANSLTWSTDGSHLFWIDSEGSLRVWSADEPQTVLRLGAGALPLLRAVSTSD